MQRSLGMILVLCPMALTPFLKQVYEKSYSFSSSLLKLSNIFSQASKDFLTTVKVDVTEVTDIVDAIQTKNTLNGIYVREVSHNYSTPVANKLSTCCDYEFLILNRQCQNDVSMALYFTVRPYATECLTNVTLQLLSSQ